MRLRDVILGTLRHPLHHKAGRCTICGSVSIFLCLDPDTVRNNMYCMRCVSSSRNRHLAKVLLAARGERASSIKALSRKSDIRILNANRGDAFGRVLKDHPYFHSFILDPDKPLGFEFEERQSCQNLENLQYEDESFDVVITEDVFEHVHDPMQGFREVHRVLAPEGSHFFTIPFNFDKKTVTRFQMVNGGEVHHLPPHYHGDKIRGRVLVVSDFGYDLLGELEEMGFQTEVTFARYADRRNGILDSFVFHSRKRRA